MGAHSSKAVIVLGVDPGSVKLGYGVIRVTGAKLAYLACGLLSAPAGWPTWRRFVELGRDLESVVADVQAMREPHEPVACAMEAGYVDGHASTALVLAAARGIATFVMGVAFGEVRTYAPATVKLAATGHGNADKEHVSKMVRLRLAMHSPPGPDETDALAIAMCRAFDT